ncbi:RNA polymerase factor sigma-54 [Evansella sp. AB-P1]|uniref:RNA polymerase factor sigma-54 n=1 Tax=Evansella sp. AB-P1 TaxID=3037653 RepID=UPI00241F9ECD|nr:RNA polymerase factor sigma-54 [Evansella sp. AB-P1]MDG5786598.1 RNA polymerase factor sigma-54 [Evansella sp. AB-P1]
MNMDFGLFQQQSMKLVMTNELRQAITILQYSVLELTHYLHEQQLENPLIELKDSESHSMTKVENMKITNSHPDTSGKFQGQDDTYSGIDHLSVERDGLQEFLLNQIRFLNIDDHIKKIVTYLACCVDENGYLQLSPNELAVELNGPTSLIEEGISVLQSLEPYGIGASSLKECLLIQLNHLGVRDVLAERIVEHHLDLLGERKFKQIAAIEKADIEDIYYIANFIQTLNPKPGTLFNHEPAKYVVPDVTVLKNNDGFDVVLNEEYMPKMTMNRRYEALLKNEDAEVNEYVKRKYEQFQWIKKSIEQRQRTIVNVTRAIMSYQVDFLKHGPTHLSPLTLKMIADEVQVHESTVSRVTTQKYVQTPKGLFELKYFFTSSVGKNSEESNSSEKVKSYLKRLVEEEKKQAPLSDQKLSEKLKEQFGITVSRRTVAKYREQMNIPSSKKRKSFFL